MFELLETTIQQYHKALQAGETTCVAAVSTYLDRISALDKSLRSMIHLNPQSISLAQEYDHRIGFWKEDPLTPLFGVPVVLKDTFCTYNLPTTAGSKAMIGLQTHDAPIVRTLKAAGAIIIGKANCSELCVSGFTASSLGGQTLNPYDLTRTPGGSSGGTAVALAANLAMVGCGGDTMNSIRSPASACNIVGLRPSAGRISYAGIFPCAWSQDAIGPMARTVEDVRVLFDVMRRAGDPGCDDVAAVPTSTVPSTAPPESVDAVAVVPPPAPLLHRKPKIGLLKYYFPRPGENEDAEAVLGVMNKAIDQLGDCIDFVSIPEDDLGSEINVDRLIFTVDVQRFELAAGLEKFFESNLIVYSPHKTLQSIADSGHYDASAVGDVFHRALEPGQNTAHADYHEHRLRMSDLLTKLTTVLDKFGIDALLFPHQRRLVMTVGPKSQPGRQGLLASLTGSPSLCIPAGFSPRTDEAPLGVPVGMELLGRHGADHLLLDIGEIMSKKLACRKAPIDKFK